MLKRYVSNIYRLPDGLQKKPCTDFNFYKRVFFYGGVANNTCLIGHVTVTETLNQNIPKWNRLRSSLCAKFNRKI